MNGFNWQLWVSYTLHLAATVLWLGGLTFACLALHPTWRRSQPNLATLNTASVWYRRFLPVAGICSSGLLVSGLLQMAASPHYHGLLQIIGQWGWAMLVKHILYALFSALTLYSMVFWQPAWQRACLRANQTQAFTPAWQLLQQQIICDWLGLGFSIFILACSAIARVA